ncbi:MAG: hypothetical protein L3J24_12040 [Xanthomonadales bacterium]|nr:hypothetical protein [Xanthomonadales bacterium]
MNQNQCSDWAGICTGGGLSFNPGNGGSVSELGDVEDPDEKEKYCKQAEAFTEFLKGLFTGSATPVTGTAASGYSLAVVAQGVALITIGAAHRDISDYNRIGIRPSVPFGSLINWQQANIDWDYSGYENFGASHVFAAWVKSVGLGNGTSTVLTDPDPSTPC